MFSQTTEYALRAAVWLAQAEGPQTTAAIAEATQVPPDYLAKILRSLARAGIVHAARGPHGGFVLERPAAALSILDIVNVVDPIVRLKTCPLGLTSHGTKLCPLHRKMDDALAAMEAAFCSSTLADLVNVRQRRPLCEIAV
jgi:Rrf2 family transcriptional regulator, nitric oxide-sensitive transcriptional repressor